MLADGFLGDLLRRGRQIRLDPLELVVRESGRALTVGESEFHSIAGRLGSTAIGARLRDPVDRTNGMGRNALGAIPVLLRFRQPFENLIFQTQRGTGDAESGLAFSASGFFAGCGGSDGVLGSAGRAPGCDVV